MSLVYVGARSGLVRPVTLHLNRFLPPLRYSVPAAMLAGGAALWWVSDQVEISMPALAMVLILLVLGSMALTRRLTGRDVTHHV